MRTTTISTPTDSSTAASTLEVVIRGLLYLYIFLLPFKWLLFVERHAFIILLVLLVLWGAVNRSHLFCRTPIDLALFVFLGWVAFTIPFATFPLYSFKEFGKLMQQVVVFYAVLLFFKDTVHRLRLIWLLIGQLLLVSLYGIGQFISMIGPASGTGATLQLVESVMNGEVWLTTYLILLLPLAFVFSLFASHRNVRVACGVTAALATLCLLLTMSRAGLIALAVELIALGWMLGRKLFVVASVSLIAAVLAVLFIRTHYDVKTIPGTPVPLKTNIGSINHRVKIWKFTVARVAEHPWVGIGFGKENFKMVYGPQPEPPDPSGPRIHTSGTHNTYLDMALGVGIPGLLLFLALMGGILVRSLRAVRKTEARLDKAVLLGAAIGVLGMLVRLFFDHMLIGPLAIMFWILVGLAVGTMNTYRTHQEPIALRGALG